MNAEDGIENVEENEDREDYENSYGPFIVSEPGRYILFVFSI